LCICNLIHDTYENVHSISKSLLSVLELEIKDTSYLLNNMNGEKFDT